MAPNCVVGIFRSALIFTFVVRSQASSLATFSDEKCQDSLEGITGPNGYPSGTCTPLDIKGHGWKSFQVVGLDHACTATIYGKDVDLDTPCSSTTLEFAHIATCYNASWVYYSIDLCDPPEGTPSPSAASPPSSKTNKGAIAGGVVGGVCAVAAIIGMAFWYVRRRRVTHDAHAAAQEGVPATPLAELPPHHTKQEIYSHQGQPPQEMGRSSVYGAPAELQGDEIVIDDGRARSKVGSGT